MGILSCKVHTPGLKLEEITLTYAPLWQLHP
jgi:hypothetical protein